MIDETIGEGQDTNVGHQGSPVQTAPHSRQLIQRSLLQSPAAVRRLPSSTIGLSITGERLPSGPRHDRPTLSISAIEVEPLRCVVHWGRH
jgi:hypothetical protein